MAKAQLQPITNRSGNDGFSLPADGFIQIAPVGEFNHPSGIIQVIDEKAIAAMINRFDTESKKENFPGLLLDFDHFSSDTKAPSTAAGWLEELQNRADGLWAKVRWTTDGKAAVKGGNYRLVSPVWLKSECEDLTNNRYRPLCLDRAALTNDPVLKGMKPVSNRSGSGDNEGMVTREEMAAAIAEAVKNAGNSAGAHKGWETRRGALSAHHAASAKMHADIAGRTTDPANKESHLKMAASHEALAKSYSGKAKVSGAKAKINAALDKMKKAKAATKK